MNVEFNYNNFFVVTFNRTKKVTKKVTEKLGEKVGQKVGENLTENQNSIIYSLSPRRERDRVRGKK